MNHQNQSNPTSSSGTPKESKWKKWGTAAGEKAMKLSDKVSPYVNGAAAKVGAERFWPSSNDMLLEIEKCERILRAFTVEGIPSKPEKEEEELSWHKDKKVNFMQKKRKVLRKIPSKVIKEAAGIVIYTSMRTGAAPFGGAGGSGLVLSRLPDGSWSAPSAISPNNLSAGFLLGLDIFDAILVIRKPELMESFGTHKFTIGAELTVAAGPLGTGTIAEVGAEKVPIYSYVRSKGLYAGVEVMGQVFVDRFDENERFYNWPGIKAADILQGRVRVPASAHSLHRALQDAENGFAQGDRLEKVVFDEEAVVPPPYDSESEEKPREPVPSNSTNSTSSVLPPPPRHHSSNIAM